MFSVSPVGLSVPFIILIQEVSGGVRPNANAGDSRAWGIKGLLIFGFVVEDFDATTQMCYLCCHSEKICNVSW